MIQGVRIVFTPINTIFIIQQQLLSSIPSSFSSAGSSEDDVFSHMQGYNFVMLPLFGSRWEIYHRKILHMNYKNRCWEQLDVAASSNSRCNQAVSSPCTIDSANQAPAPAGSLQSSGSTAKPAQATAKNMKQAHNSLNFSSAQLLSADNAIMPYFKIKFIC